MHIARLSRSSPLDGLSCFFIAVLHCAPLLVNAQASEKNGQFLTKGLAVIDSPAPNTLEHTGSSFQIAIDLSGENGIPQSSFLPSSGADTGYDFFEIYLVSQQVNLTVIPNGSVAFLQGPGGTVKKVDFIPPACLNSGAYNLTFYEGSHINGSAFFSITPLSIDILNNSSTVSGDPQCQSISNPVEQQPQVDSPPGNPFEVSPTASASASALQSSSSIGASDTDPVPSTTVATPVVSTSTIVSTNAQGLTVSSIGLETMTSSMMVPATSAHPAGGFFFAVNNAVHISPRSLLVTVLLCSALLFVAFAW